MFVILHMVSASTYWTFEMICVLLHILSTLYSLMKKDYEFYISSTLKVHIQYRELKFIYLFSLFYTFVFEIIGVLWGR